MPLASEFVPPPWLKFTVDPAARAARPANDNARSWLSVRVVRTPPSPAKGTSVPDACSAGPAPPTLSTSNVPPRMAMLLAEASVPVVTFSDSTPPENAVVPV